MKKFVLLEKTNGKLEIIDTTKGEYLCGTYTDPSIVPDSYFLYRDNYDEENNLGLIKKESDSLSGLLEKGYLVEWLGVLMRVKEIKSVRLINDKGYDLIWEVAE